MTFIIICIITIVIIILIYQFLRKAAKKKNQYKNVSNYGTNKNKKKERPFHRTTISDKETVTILGNINSRGKHGQTPLHSAIFASDFEITKLLIESGADVNAKNNRGLTPLHIACISSPNVEIMKLLIDYGADINVKAINGYESFFHMACLCTDNLDILKLMIERGVEINAKEKHGKTPLHLTCIESKFDTTKLLIQNGADINAKSNMGSTPLHLVCEKGNNFKMVKLLKQLGADLNARNEEGSTPLHVVGRKGDIEMVKLLIQLGADINAKDNKGNGPLHEAVWNDKNYELIQFLLKNGADVNDFNKANETPLFIASFWGRIDYVKLMLQNGAIINFCSDKIDQLYEKSRISFEFIRMIRQHLIKLKMLNLANEEMFTIWRLESTSIEVKRFEEYCKKEAQKLREKICINRNVRFSDLITKNWHQVAVFLNVEEINDKLSHFIFDEKFPIYSDLLKYKIEKCKYLAELLSDAKESLKFLFQKPQTPDIVLTKILRFLNLKDMKVLNFIIQIK